MSAEISDMVENIDGALGSLSPERLLVAQERRSNPALLGEDRLDDRLFSESLGYAHHVGKGAEFLTIALSDTVTQILNLLQNPAENVTALCDGLLDNIRRQHGDRFAQIVAGFLWRHGEPHQFISPSTAAILDLADFMPPELASRVLTEIGGRAFVLS